MSATVFEYRAIDGVGKRRTGTATAADQDSAYRQIVSLGLVPVSLRMVRSRSAGRGSKKIRPRDIAQFTFALGVLIEARIPISEALLGLAEEETNQSLRRVLMDVAARVQAGQPIASSLAEHRSCFNTIYLESIHAAEKTGNLVKVLAHLSEMLERMDESRRAVKSALMYPAVVVTTLSLSTVFLIVFAVPKFAAMFAGKGLQLPFLTRVLMIG
ncbi:MAG: type II secretion system F family protein, partial [Pyrinomonadaceae bacterium]|nr:type II secretion system F family protein [Phycisphaerales bacterium]